MKSRSHSCIRVMIYGCSIILLTACSTIKPVDNIHGKWESVEFVGNNPMDASQNKVILDINQEGQVTIKTRIGVNNKFNSSSTMAQIKGDYLFINNKKVTVLENGEQLLLIDEENDQSIVMQKVRVVWRNSVDH